MKTESHHEHQPLLLGYRGLLVDAIEGRIASAAEFGNRLRALGYKLGSRMRALIVSPRRGLFGIRQANRLLTDISNTYPFGDGLLYKDRLFFLLTAGSADSVTRADYARFESFLKKSEVVAAFGEWGASDEEVRALYVSALFTLEVGRCAHPENALHFFEDCRSLWPFEVCIRAGNPALYLSPAIDLLDDRGRHHDLPHVLRVLVENGGNRSAAAAELGIQRNTLQVRIQEIESLTGIDLSDPGEVDYLRRCFKLEQHRNRSGWGTHGLGSSR